MDRPRPDTAARRFAALIVRPLERFLRVEAASGIVLLAAAAIALAWANSPWSSTYERIWQAPVPIGVAGLTRSVQFWINDGLMAVFFLVAGLEIRREIHEGELSDAKRAALPVAAALGGMLAPALIYLGLNRGPETSHGWGVPTATDIAFAVGVLALLGKRVPPALRVLLLALAIIDDIGAIVIIAIFYSSGVVLNGLLLMGAGILGVLLMQRLRIRRAVAYLVPGAVVWAGLFHAGVHPAISGVILGLLTPVRGDRPVVRVQAALHPWVAYGIMPLFALANAGVGIGGLALDQDAPRAIALGVAAGLFLGKPLGVSLATWITVRAGICALPRGVGWRGILLVGCVAGIGFTMAIFTAGLAFDDPTKLGAAKLGVLLASTLAGIGGALVGRLVLPPVAPDAARTVHEAETSTEK